MTSSRRTLLQRLGVSAGGALLASVVGQLLPARALANTPPRRRPFIVLLVGNGLPRGLHRPEGLATTGALDTRTFTLPTVFAALEPWRDRLTLIDGVGGFSWPDNHTSNSGFLSARAEVNADPGPQGITLDQHLAIERADAAARPFRSVLYGVDRGTANTRGRVFASRKGQYVPFVGKPTALFETLFGAAAGSVETTKRKLKERVLLDSMRRDLATLDRNLPASEKAKLDVFVQSIDAMERRAMMPPPACGTAPELPPDAGLTDVQFSRMTPLAGIALTCGLTDVVGMALGCGHTHQEGAVLYSPAIAAGSGTRFERENWNNNTTTWEPFGGPIETHGHSPVYLDAMRCIWRYAIRELRVLADALSAVPVDGGTLWDDTTVLICSDNGDGHHAGRQQSPFVVIGPRRPQALASGGRYLRKTFHFGAMHAALCAEFGLPPTFADRTAEPALLA
ncbi:MAG: DUF1552 domain-containing protein [Myxococcaceae bacterium]|nr:DUF1552 domain-containing protein [Myxococcaceae bacterium]